MANFIYIFIYVVLQCNNTLRREKRFKTVFCNISIFQDLSIHLRQQTLQYFTDPTVCQAIRIGYGYDASAL